MNVAVYKRVSTDKQDTESQQHAITQWLEQRGIQQVSYYVDQGLSGKRDDRPEFQRMCDDVRAGKVDTVIVYALDRLSRKSTTAMSLLLEWMQDDVAFYSVTQPMLQLGLDNPLRMTICAIFADIAELERKTIVGRIKNGLEAARKRGAKLGRPTSIPDDTRNAARSLRAAGSSYATIAEQLGISVYSAHSICKR